jgi:hypothetical protein
MAVRRSNGRGNLIVGIVLVGLGALFLMGQYFDLNLWHFLWPFFIIVPGLMFFVGMLLGGKAAGPLAIPGSIVTMVGLLLLYQVIFNHFESWAYAWALIFPTSVGIGLMINGGWSDDERLIHNGLRWAGIGIAIFVVLGVFFELILNISGSYVGRIVWPMALIGFGAYLLMRHSGRRVEGGNGHKPPVEIESAAKPVEKPPEPTGPEFEPLDMTRSKKK